MVPPVGGPLSWGKSPHWPPSKGRPVNSLAVGAIPVHTTTQPHAWVPTLRGDLTHPIAPAGACLPRHLLC